MEEIAKRLRELASKIEAGEFEVSGLVWIIIDKDAKQIMAEYLGDRHPGAMAGAILTKSAMQYFNDQAAQGLQ